MKDFLRKTGLPSSLAVAYLGVLVFMMGEGIEQTWLSKFLVDNGIDSAKVFSVYGFAVAVSAWLSGITAEAVGVKKTMWTGFAMYVASIALFAGWGIGRMNYPVIMMAYALKGLSYPLFSYTFMVWIAYRVEKKSLSGAQGWFWFVFTGGVNVLGAYYGIFAKQCFGPVAALWTATLFATAGAILALVVNRCSEENICASKGSGSGLDRFRELVASLSIVRREPRILVGGIIRSVNNISVSAFVVFMPIYMSSCGLPDVSWGIIWATVFAVNIVFNLVFGTVGDRFGWGPTVTLFGCIGCAVGILAFFYSAQICCNFWLILACGSLWGAMLAGFVPLSALIPSFVDKGKGAAVSVLNLGGGIGTFLGPVLVGVMAPLGYASIAWVLAALCAVGAVLTFAITRGEKKPVGWQ